MNSINKILVYAVTVLMSGFNCYGQNSSLKDLSRIELITAGAWIDGYYKKVEVVNENGQWKSYQTRLASNGYSRDRKAVNDSSRTFLMDVPDKTLIKFLSLLVKPDSVIREELFNIKTADLVTQIDSLIAMELRPYGDMKEPPPAQWRNDFVKTVKFKPKVSEAFFHATHFIPMDDRSWYYIILTDKSKRKDTIRADAHGELYYLPWHINNKESYNPNITKLFELLSGNTSFEQKEKNHLHQSIVLNMYYDQSFKGDLEWLRFKKEQPEIYALASKTLRPLKFTNYNKGSTTPEMGFTGNFISSKLPAFIQLRGSYASGYPDLILESNALECRLIAWYKSGSFLLNHVKNHPHAILSFVNSIKYGQYDEVLEHYPDLKRFDKTQVYMFRLIENLNYENASTWLLTPDDKVILIGYRGKLSDSYQNKLEFIPQKKYQDKYVNVCIVFDKNRKKVGGTDVPFNVKRTD